MSVPSGKNSEVFTILSEKYNFNTEKKLGTRSSNQAVSWQTYDPTSGVSNNTAIQAGDTARWSIQANGPFLASDPYLQVELDVKLTLTNTNAVPVNSEIGVKPLPINRCISSSQVVLNNMTEVSSQPNQQVDMLSLAESQDLLSMISSAYKFQPLSGYDGTFLQDVLRTFGDSPSGSSNHISNFEFKTAYATAVAGSALEVTFVIYLREKLCARPFQYHDHSPRPLLGVSKLDVELTFSNEMSRLIQFNNANTITAVDRCQFKNPKLVFLNETPSLKVPIPRKCYWNSIKHVEYVKSATSAAGTVEIESDSVQHNVVPKAWGVYVKQKHTNAVTNATTPERLLPITNISLDFGNRENLAQGYSQYDLYQISSRNGYNLRYPHFAGINMNGTLKGNGSLLILLPSDVGSEYQSNMMANYVTRWRVTCDTSLIGAGNDIELHVVELYDNVLEYNDGVYQDRYASLTPEQVEMSKNIYKNVVFDDYQIMGGSFWSGLKNVVKKVGKVAKDVVTNPAFKQGVKTLRNTNPRLARVAGDETPVGQVLSSFGYGDQVKPKRKAPAKKKTKKGKGVYTMGGAVLNRKDLQDLLEE